MVLPHKLLLFASKFDTVCQRLASHKGLNLDHLLNVPLAYKGEIIEPKFPADTTRKASQLTAACETYLLFETEITESYGLAEALDSFGALHLKLLQECKSFDDADGRNRVGVY